MPEGWGGFRQALMPLAQVHIGCIHMFHIQLVGACPKTFLLQLPFASLQDLMCCRDVYGVALFVHKCMKIANAAAVAAARQQPR
jgi:hypothetical protein